MTEPNNLNEEIPNCLNCRNPMKCSRKYSYGSDWECEKCGSWQRRIIPLDERK